MNPDWIIPRFKHTLKLKIGCTIATGFVGLTSRIFACYLNKTKFYNLEQLHELVYNRPDNQPLITVCNHDSCTDDPLMIGASIPASTFLRYKNRKYLRWSLGAREICHSKKWLAILSQLGKVLPIDRGAGIYQPIMNEMVEILEKGSWCHIFPEGRVNEKKEFIRFKWGVGRLVADCQITPVVLPFYILGCDDVLPNKSPYRPTIGNKLTMVVGKPLYFDNLVKEMKEKQRSAMEMRKTITDKIQEEFLKLKEEAYAYHNQHLKSA